MRQTENSQIGRIIPLTQRETIDFYTTGKMPERFTQTDTAKRHEILQQHGVNDTFIIRESDEI